MPRVPTGYVATCKCGKTIAALDRMRMDWRHVAKLLIRWLVAGCTVSPRFEHTWSVIIEPCMCEPEETVVSNLSDVALDDRTFVTQVPDMTQARLDQIFCDEG